jgi:hypothetical protein
MADVLIYGLLAIAVICAGVVVYTWGIPAIPVIGARKRSPYQGIVKRDWLPTGRIDFSTQLEANAEVNDQPSDFKLLVEERRIVESVAGNENLEIQWRLATLKEAKAVITQYHKYLSENSLIRSVSDDLASPPPPTTAQSSPSDSPIGTRGDEAPPA